MRNVVRHAAKDSAKSLHALVSNDYEVGAHLVGTINEGRPGVSEPGMELRVDAGHGRGSTNVVQNMARLSRIVDLIALRWLEASTTISDLPLGQGTVHRHDVQSGVLGERKLNGGVHGLARCRRTVGTYHDRAKHQGPTFKSLGPGYGKHYRRRRRFYRKRHRVEPFVARSGPPAVVNVRQLSSDG
jgi:hypothetical protein